MPEISLKVAQVPEDTSRPTTADVEVPDTSVIILYPTRGADLHVLWHRGVTLAREADQQRGHHNIWGEKSVITGANVSKARNECVRYMLDETDCEWGWFLDTDMVIDEDTLPRLLCTAQVTGAEVVGGLCVIADDADGPIPTLYQLGNFGAGEVTRVMFDYPDNALYQVAATGAACLLVHRKVLEHIRELSPDNPNYCWFREDVVNKEWLSEDIYFALLANSTGHPVFVDCTTHVGHAKQKFVWWPEDIRRKRGFPPIKDYVIIPVKDKLHLTSALVGQLRSQGGCTEIIIVDNGSGTKTKNWLASQDDLTVITMPDAGIHEMWNAGIDYVATQGQRRNVNVHFLNNDLELGPRYITRMSHALRADYPDRALVALSANYDNRQYGDAVLKTDDICAGRYDGTGGFAGFAFAVRGEWLESGYRFPEECKWWYGDNDLIAAIYSASGWAGIAIDARVTHLDGGGGTAGDPLWEKFKEQTDKDREAFVARWQRITAARGGVPLQENPTFEQVYEALCKQWSDVQEHLPTFVDLCERTDAENIIELGVRSGISTVAWLVGADRTKGQVWSVDVGPKPDIKHDRWVFFQGDDTSQEILDQLPPEADVIFIDTSHRYAHTVAEIGIYRERVRPGGCLVFHDTNVETFPEHEGTEDPYPVRRAVDEFVEEWGWKLERYENCYGLSVVWRPEETGAQ